MTSISAGTSRASEPPAPLIARIPVWLFVHIGWIGGGLIYLWIPYWGFSVAILFFACWFAMGLTLSLRRAFQSPAAGPTLSPERTQPLGFPGLASIETAGATPHPVVSSIVHDTSERAGPAGEL